MEIATSDMEDAAQEYKDGRKRKGEASGHVALARAEVEDGFTWFVERRTRDAVERACVDEV